MPMERNIAITCSACVQAIIILENCFFLFEMYISCQFRAVLDRCALRRKKLIEELNFKVHSHDDDLQI
jgi:hypothetical protein